MIVDVIVGFFLLSVDVFLGLSGLRVFSLLLICPYLFIRQYSPVTSLYLGGGAAFCVELIYHLKIGSLILGVGVVVILFHWILDFINWQFALAQVLGLFVYLLVIFLVRVIFIRAYYGHWVLSFTSPFLFTYLIGLILIAYSTIVGVRPNPTFNR